MVEITVTAYTVLIFKPVQAHSTFKILISLSLILKALKDRIIIALVIETDTSKTLNDA